MLIPSGRFETNALQRHQPQFSVLPRFMNDSLGCLPCSRRQFLSNVAACACCAAGGLTLGASALRANSAQTSAKPKIRVVFRETANDKPIWPNLGYDFDARRRQLLAALTQGCPELEFSESKLMDNPGGAEEVLKNSGEAQGYVVCAQGLGWGNDLARLCSTGKPTLLVDSLFGGSGHFLTQLPGILKSGKPVDWVSSSQDEDVIASVREFGLLQRGKAPAEVAAAFRETRRRNTPRIRDWACKEDPISKPDLDQALRQLRRTKILVVGSGWGGDGFSKAAADVIGVQFVPLDFKVLAAAYDDADLAAAKEFADRWIGSAEKVVEPSREDIDKSGAMYVAMKKLLAEHGAQGISINCLGGFYGGHIKAYPCLGFSQFNNDGQVGGCEGDQMSALTMAVMGAVTGRPGFISDPVIDTAKNSIVYTHCVAVTKPFGVRGAANAYQIRNHSEDRKGAALQSLLPSGYMTTTLEINPVTKQVSMHRAKTIGNNPSDMACRTKLQAVVKGDLEKLTENWRMGWHRVTFYGDHKDTITELSARLKLDLIEEA
jgi:hypothetical protein